MVLKKQNKTKTAEAFLSVLPSRKFFQNVVPTKNLKGAGKAFLIKIKNKMLLQKIRIM